MFHLAVDITNLLSALLPMAFSSESKLAVFTATLHSAVIVVPKLAHLYRTFWDTVFKLTPLRVALRPQPDGALDGAVILGA